ncbi:hypothetical protein HY971_04745 [Candidatus Kaiserbacteria bacterium]|nr:hypothetical protein [Candidatus Kaiserbacteria bacterium]
MGRIHITFEGKELTQSKFDEIEKKVLEYFQNLWNEIQESVRRIRKEDHQHLKSELCLAFIGADSLARFAEIITTGEEGSGPGKSERRFRNWIDSYVLTDGNETYKEWKRHINCDSQILWKIRCSLLHFYGIPLLDKEHIVFSSDHKLVEKLNVAIAGRPDNRRARAIDPYRLINALRDGFLTQLETFRDLLLGTDESKKEVYLRGTVKVYEIIKYEGTVFVPIKKK